MIQYIIKGLVLPIRAGLSFGPIKFVVNDSIFIELTVYYNEITIYYEIEKGKNIFDIKNECLNYCNSMVSQIGFIKGYGYNIEINQILCKELDINHVFGIDIPCLVERNKNYDIKEQMDRFFSIEGREKRYLERCFIDLQLSIKYPIDTPFYCYRAIETLRHFCGEKFKIKTEKKQWQKLSEITKKDIDDIKKIKDFANEARHGNHKGFSSDERKDFFLTTWDIVDSFIDYVNSL